LTGAIRRGTMRYSIGSKLIHLTDPVSRMWVDAFGP